VFSSNDLKRRGTENVGMVFLFRILLPPGSDNHRLPSLRSEVTVHYACQQKTPGKTGRRRGVSPRMIVVAALAAEFVQAG
jgi:hypothetical protein